MVHLFDKAMVLVQSPRGGRVGRLSTGKQRSNLHRIEFWNTI